MRHGSESDRQSDRPDSGFDSNRDLEEREEEGAVVTGTSDGVVTMVREAGGEGEAGAQSSPETVKISRQAATRQPLKKKRNFTHHY